MPLILIVPRFGRYAAGDVIDEADEARFATRGWAVAEVSEADAKREDVLAATLKRLAGEDGAEPDGKPKPAPAPAVTAEKSEQKAATKPAAEPAEEAKS
jgi:hypothetical protein